MGDARDDAYRRVRVIEGELGGQVLQLETRPGFPNWGEVDPAMQLLASHAQIESGDRVVVSPCGYGGLGIWAAGRTSASVAVSDVNMVAVELAARNLARHGHPRVVPTVGLPSHEPDSCDVMLMALPKGRDLSRLYLTHAYEALRPGGRLYLAGPNQGGVKSVIKDASELFGAAAVLAYKAGHRVAVSTRPSKGELELPEWSAAPGLRPGSYHALQLQVGAQSYRLETKPGVFAWQGLDAGTALLLGALRVRPDERFLDLGCGYGILGLHLARLAETGSGVLLDSDGLACDCAGRNLLTNGVRNAQVVLGDGVAALAGHRFSLIATNPPFHSGREQTLEIAQAFVSESYEALDRRGTLYLVANRFLPYAHQLRETFQRVEIVAQTSRYQVLRADRLR